MAISIVVGLYTSRLILQVLGVEDYGIYGVLSSVVILLTFANNSLENASSRYITFNLGKCDINLQRSTFASSLRLHIIVAIVVLILAETLGLWIISHKLDIPPEKSDVAITAYHLIAITTAIGFLKTPFNSCIIAHERFKTYTIIELGNVAMKLAIAFILINSDNDKLIFYAVLLLLSTLIITLIHIIYCKLNFAECRLLHKADNATTKSLIKFASWDLYGNMCVSTREQGTNILINTFFGVILNAAVSIATLIYTYFTMMTYNVIRAFSPQITKQYAKGNIVSVQHLLTNCTKAVILSASLIAIPLYLECEKILSFWLVAVPDYSVTFTRLLIISASIGLITNTTNCLIHATGKIKAVSFITGTIYLTSIPITYVLLRQGHTPEVAYITIATTTLLGLISNIAIMKHLVAGIKLTSITTQLLPTLMLVTIVIASSAILHNTIHNDVTRLTSIIAVDIITVGICFTKLFFNSKTSIKSHNEID